MSPGTAVPPLPSIRAAGLDEPAAGVALGKTIAKRVAIGDDYSASFHQVEFWACR
jgi:hypothetical protein